MNLMYNQPKILKFLGRNGVGFCAGLNFREFNFGQIPYIHINPITSQGNQGRCWIQIPKDQASEVCDAIQADTLDTIFDRLNPNLYPVLLNISPSLDRKIQERMK